MLTSFIAHDSWINHVTQMIYINDNFTPYQYVELFTYKKLLIINLVELEHDEETSETFEQHRKFITSDTQTALNLINDCRIEGMRLSSIGLVQFNESKEVEYSVTKVEDIFISTDSEGVETLELHLQDGKKIIEKIPVILL